MDKKSMLEAIITHFADGNKSQLARILNVSPQAISTWLSRGSFDNELIYAKCENINPDWLLTGRGTMLKPEPVPLMGDKAAEKAEVLPKAIPARPKREIQILHHPKVADKVIVQQTIPVYNVEAAANLKTVFDNKDQNILGEITMPNIPRCDGAIYVRGDSMYPLLKSGDIVGYKEIQNFANVIFGEMYIIAYDIEGDEYVCVKYINHSDRDGFVKLVSYNPHHDPKDIPVAQISAMALVKFSIRMNTII